MWTVGYGAPNRPTSPSTPTARPRAGRHGSIARRGAHGQFVALTLLVGALPACLSCVLGCAPRVVLKCPPDLPGEWAGHQLYNTPHAYIYASTDTAAGEIDRLVRSAAARRVRQPQGQSPKGLVLVIDSHDRLPADMAVPLLRAASCASRTNRSDGAGDQTDLTCKLVEVENQLREAGADLNVVVMAVAMKPFPLRQEDITEVLAVSGDVPQDVGWSAAVATRAACESVAREIMSCILKDKDVTAAQCIFFLPLMPLLQAKMSSAMSQARDDLIDSQLGVLRSDQRARPATTQPFFFGAVHPARPAE